MRVLKTTIEVRANDENEAKTLTEKYRADASEKGYIINSIGYTYKVKKSKGVIIDDAYVVKCVQEYGSIWSENDE